MLTADFFVPGILGHPDRNFSRNFFIANWEKIIICPKSVSVRGSNPPKIEIHPSPSCICPGPIFGRGRIFEKIPLWGPKIDFSQNEQMWPVDSKTLSRRSLGLVWPPPSVVSISMTLGEIWIFDNFGRFWPFWAYPKIWPWSPTFQRGYLGHTRNPTRVVLTATIVGESQNLMGPRVLQPIRLHLGWFFEKSIFGFGSSQFCQN